MEILTSGLPRKFSDVETSITSSVFLVVALQNPQRMANKPSKVQRALEYAYDNVEQAAIYLMEGTCREQCAYG